MFQCKVSVSQDVEDIMDGICEQGGCFEEYEKKLFFYLQSEAV